jgi:hypothetical protein
MCIQVPCYVFHVSCPTCALGHGTDPEAGAPLMSIEKASGIWHREQVQWDPVKPLLERRKQNHTKVRSVVVVFKHSHKSSDTHIHIHTHTHTHSRNGVNAPPSGLLGS